MLIENKDLSPANIIGLYEVFAQMVFQQNYEDVFSMKYASKLIESLLERYEDKLADLWKKFVHIGCSLLTKLQVRHQDRLVAADLKIKRHIIYQAVRSIITRSKKAIHDVNSIIYWANEVVSMLS